MTLDKQDSKDLVDQMVPRVSRAILDQQDHKVRKVPVAPVDLKVFLETKDLQDPQETKDNRDHKASEV